MVPAPNLHQNVSAVRALVTSLPACAMPSTLTKAEHEDFAAAQVPPQAPQVATSTAASLSSTPRNGKKHRKGRRFTFKRLSRKHEPITEAEHEAAVALTSPASSVSSGSDSTSSLSTETSVNKQPAGPQDFDLLCVIGQGAFGKVIQVRHQHTDEILAMKVSAVRRDAVGGGLLMVFCFLFDRSCQTSTSCSTTRCRTCRRRGTS
jgi:hypothetical protein